MIHAKDAFMLACDGTQICQVVNRIYSVLDDALICNCCCLQALEPIA
jgi:hypothetical protein